MTVTETTIETATQWMIALANDNSHGYDENNRWGPDYDCSSAVITAWETAGVPVKGLGATSTSNMRNVFIQCGFAEVFGNTDINLSDGVGLHRGDVLLREPLNGNGGYVAMYIGGNQMVHARWNEFGGTTGGLTGDQNDEITISGYSNDYGWTSVLRFSFTGNFIIQAGQIHANNFVGAGLILHGYRSPATITAGIKVLQHAMNLDYNAGLAVDGSFGPLTQAALGSHYVMYDETQYMVTAAQILLMLQGFDPNGVESPGHFGNGMLNAVMAFQSAQNLPVTGICNNATFIKLIQ